jgi:predicted phage terminase large subunit-like protein
MPSKPPFADLGISNLPAFMAELVRNDFASFVIGAYPNLRGGADLLPNWHLDAIAFELQRVFDGISHRLLVTLPPRNLKSLMMSVMWVAWCLGRNPRMNFVCVSYASELSKKHARDCRHLMQTAWYRKLFPRTVIAGRSAAHDFETAQGGGRLATSVGGTLTGRGGDIIILDDPINPLEANSDTQRQAVNDWYASTLASRLNNKQKGAIITVMQRLHQYDLAGLLIERGDWSHLSLPAIATESVAIPLTRGRIHYRKEGEVLHPAHESKDALEIIRRDMGSSYFNAQYQQAPVPAGGNILKLHWFKTYDPNFNPFAYGRIVQSWDTASKDGQANDFSVGITAHIHNSKVIILDVFRRKMEFPELKREVLRLARQWRTQALLIEDAASGMHLIQQLRAEEPHGIPLPIARKPDGDKVSRMHGVSGQIEAGQRCCHRMLIGSPISNQSCWRFPMAATMIRRTRSLN